ncbi:Bax inhibitor 1 like protein [compost metagenome]
MRSGNPALSTATFQGLPTAFGNRMTLSGTVNKTLIMLALVIAAAFFTWNQALVQGDNAILPLLMGVGAIGGLIVALVTIFKKEWAPVTAPIYAVLQGLLLGGLSSLLNSAYPGIVIQAVGLTFGVALSLLLVYRSGLVKVTDNFRMGIVAATGGIFLVYLVSFGMSLFGLRMPLIHESGLFGIGFSLFVVAIAALNLVLDFDFIERGAESGAPKFMEWYGAFGLMVTLVWLYIEILHLLAKLQGRRD